MTKEATRPVGTHLQGQIEGRVTGDVPVDRVDVGLTNGRISQLATVGQVKRIKQTVVFRTMVSLVMLS